MRIFPTVMFVIPIILTVAITYLSSLNRFNILEVYSIGPLHYTNRVKEIDLSNTKDNYYINTETNLLYVQKFNGADSIKFVIKVSKLKSINTVSQILDKSDTLRIVYLDSDRIDYPPNPHLLKNRIRQLLFDNTVSWFETSVLNDFILKGYGDFKIYYFIRDFNKKRADLIEIDRTMKLKITVYRLISDYFPKI